MNACSRGLPATGFDSRRPATGAYSYSAAVPSCNRRANAVRRRSCIEQMLARKPRLLVTVALANKMALIIWVATYKAGELQGSGRSQGLSPADLRAVVGDVVGRRRVWHNLKSTHLLIWFRPANAHTGLQLHCCIRGRTDGSIRLRANARQKPLASREASVDLHALDPAHHG
jgi:hypothetical protein